VPGNSNDPFTSPARVNHTGPFSYVRSMTESSLILTIDQHRDLGEGKQIRRRDDLGDAA
jgi:hypothetical protein